MLILRKVLFYVFAVLYLVCCPLTILFALGYLVQPGTGQGVVKTGVLSIATLPAGASVYVGKSRYTQTTPTVIRDLLPGDYPLQLVLRQHAPWRQTVSVEAGKATVLDRVLLMPKRLPRETLLFDRFEDIIPLPGHAGFLLRQGPRLEDLVVYDWKNDERWPVLPVEAPWGDARVADVVSVRDSAAVLLRATLQGEERWLWVEPERNDESRIQDLTDLLLGKPLRIAWDPRHARYLFAFDGSDLSRVDLATREVAPRMFRDVRGYGVAQQMVYVLHGDHTVERTDLKGERRERLLDDPLVGRALFGDKGVFEITVLSKDLLLFLGERGELLMNWPPYRFVERGVRGMAFDPQAGRLLCWQRDRLGIVDAAAPPTLSWVFERGRNIQQAFWVYEGSHVLFRDGEWVFLLDLAGQRPNPPLRLLQVKRGSAVVYAERAGTLYYLEPTAGRLCAVELLPRREWIPVPVGVEP